MIRSFLAIEIPASLQKAIEPIQGRLRRTRASVSWVQSRNIHLTLKFLGDIEPGWVDPILRALTPIAERNVPFSLEVKGLGCFPNMRNPRVIWVGIEDGEARLSKLQADVEQAMETVGFSREGRPFQSHLTIGRVRNPKGKEDLSEEIRQIGRPSLGPFEVDGITLFQSELHPQGAIYTPLGRVRFPQDRKENRPQVADGRPQEPEA